MSDHHSHLYSYPTRRSSDLETVRRAVATFTFAGWCRREFLQEFRERLVVRSGYWPRALRSLPWKWRGNHESRRADRWLDDKDRKSTRLNSSHPSISYAVFCL